MGVYLLIIVVVVFCFKIGEVFDFEVVKCWGKMWGFNLGLMFYIRFWWNFFV